MGALDPRIEPLVERWLAAFEFDNYHVVLKRLPKKHHEAMWAKCHWFHDNKEVTFWFGPTVGLSDADVEAIVVHEMSHGLSSLILRGPVGSIMDEQFCNLMTRLCVPDASRRLRGKPTWAVGMARMLNDSEREALEDVMPHFIMRLPDKYALVLKAIFYDDKNLHDIAREQGVQPSTIMRRRDKALEMMRSMFLGES